MARRDRSLVWSSDAATCAEAVTTISNVALEDAALRDLAGRLKKRCGVGGSTKGGVIELQGDHRDTVIEVLRAEGFDAVAAGG